MIWLFVESLYLCNFRNHKQEDMLFTHGVNLILGDNAQGKTNILEAIMALAAIRTSKPPLRQDAIHFDADFAEVLGAIYHENVETKLALRLSRAKRITEIYKNDVRQKRMIDVHGLLRVVSFCPDDLHLIRAGAVQRRSFLDHAIGQVSPRYSMALSKYEKFLKDKNAILKAQEEKPSLLDTLDDYTEQLCHYGAQIILARVKYCRQLLKFASQIHSEIAPQENLSAVYHTSSALEKAFPALCTVMTPDEPLLISTEKVKMVNFGEEKSFPTVNEVRQVLFDHALSMKSAELSARSALVGAHKDDLEIFINDQKAASFGSQGQVRTAALALKMAEREVSFARDGIYPVLLLDDVLSELDQKRQDFMLNQVKNGQVFITACDPIAAARFDKGRKFIIENGVCVQQSGHVDWL